MKSVKIIVIVAIVISSSTEIFSQCETWHGLSDKENLENSFVIYRDFLKRGDNEKAFQYWEIVYNNAPAADGKRATVYSDGIKLHVDKFIREKKKKKKKELVEVIDRLAKEQSKCYPESDVIPFPKEIMEFRSEVEQRKEIKKIEK